MNRNIFWPVSVFVLLPATLFPWAGDVQGQTAGAYRTKGGTCMLIRCALTILVAALLGMPQTANADVVTDWNTIAVSTVSADGVVNRHSRDMAMVHAAVFDAMNAIRPYYTPAMISMTAKGYASREAAAAQAAHDVLLALPSDPARDDFEASTWIVGKRRRAKVTSEHLASSLAA